MILLIGTLGYNVSEYILKLQLHQHSLLTRKVLSRHNFHRWSSSLDLLIICISKSSCLQVIFIFMPSSFGSVSSSLDHTRSETSLDHTRSGKSLDHTRSGTSLDHTRSGTSSLDLDHHSIWIIITRFGSSMQDLDHHSIWIITAGSGSSLNLHLSESS